MKRSIAIILAAFIICILCCACGGSSSTDSEDDKYAYTDFIRLENSVYSDDFDLQESSDSGNDIYAYHVKGEAADIMTEYADYLASNYTTNFDTARGSVFVDSKGNELSLKVLSDTITLQITIKRAG